MNSPRSDPGQEYARRLAAALAAGDGLGRQSRRLAVAKLVAILLLVLAAFLIAKQHSSALPLLAAPAALIVLLFLWHERVLRALDRSMRQRVFYQRGMERIEDRWASPAGAGEHGAGGERFLDPAHPYARDLDLFGPGSLFERLSTARTRAGEQALAGWLLAGASVEEIAARQSAVQELTSALDLREQIALAGEYLAGEDRASGVHPEVLIAWSERPDRLSPGFARRAAPLLAACWAVSVLGWLTTLLIPSHTQPFWAAAALFFTLNNLALTYRTRARVEKAAEPLDAALGELDLLAALLGQIERQSFESPRLLALQARLRSGSRTASAATADLHRRFEWFSSREHLLIKFGDLFVFWDAQWIAALEAWRARHGADVRGWLAAIGELEALLSLASYAYENPHDIYPRFTLTAPALEVRGLSHPLIPRTRAVPNHLELGRDLRLVVISGPNMAGKSTFIRALGINVVLAQAGAPVRADSMVLSPLQVAASICVLDSLAGGLSRFYAEILRLKHIDELARGPRPVLFLLDELLSGTNSHDRRVGTESFVRTLLGHGAIGLITTHDLALAAIAEGLDGRAANFHFQDSFENGELRFHYRLEPGVASTANALRLMQAVGIEIDDPAQTDR